MKKVLALTSLLVLFSFPALAQNKVKATATAHSSTLTWTAATVPAGSPAVSSYSVYRATTAGGEGSTPLATGITVATYIDSSVTAGTSYFYQVTASNSVGESSKSTEVSVAIPNLQPPNAPTNLTGTAQ